MTNDLIKGIKADVIEIIYFYFTYLTSSGLRELCRLIGALCHELQRHHVVHHLGSMLYTTFSRCDVVPIIRGRPILAGIRRRSYINNCYVCTNTHNSFIDISITIMVFTTHVPVFLWPNSHNFRDIELKFCMFF